MFTRLLNGRLTRDQARQDRVIADPSYPYYGCADFAMKLERSSFDAQFKVDFLHRIQMNILTESLTCKKKLEYLSSGRSSEDSEKFGRICHWPRVAITRLSIVTSEAFGRAQTMQDADLLEYTVAIMIGPWLSMDCLKQAFFLDNDLHEWSLSDKIMYLGDGYWEGKIADLRKKVEGGMGKP